MAFVSAAGWGVRIAPSTASRCCTSGATVGRAFPIRRNVRQCRPCVFRCCSTPPDVSVREVPFEIRGFSLANVALAGGLAITLVSFSSYFNSSGTSSATSLGFVYGVPVLLIGCALKYAELQPVPLQSTPSARALRDAAATDTQKKIVSDITRHRYGDEAHLAAVMSALGLVPRGGACPVLLGASEQEQDGKYVLALQFYSIETPYKQWEERIERMERFFGPDVTVEVEKLDAEKRRVELRIASTRKR